MLYLKLFIKVHQKYIQFSKKKLDIGKSIVLFDKLLIILKNLLFFAL